MAIETKMKSGNKTLARDTENNIYIDMNHPPSRHAKDFSVSIGGYTGEGGIPILNGFRDLKNGLASYYWMADTTSDSNAFLRHLYSFYTELVNSGIPLSDPLEFNSAYMKSYPRTKFKRPDEEGVFTVAAIPNNESGMRKTVVGKNPIHDLEQYPEVIACHIAENLEGVMQTNYKTLVEWDTIPPVDETIPGNIIYVHTTNDISDIAGPLADLYQNTFVHGLKSPHIIKEILQYVNGVRKEKN